MSTRWLHKFYAHVFGYFWLPCPACGRMFGGHEIGSADVDGRVACKKCSAAIDKTQGNI